MDQENTTTTEKQSFVADTPAKATWVLSQLRKANHAKAEVDEVYQTKKLENEEWHNKQEREYQEQVDYFKGLLKDYMDMRLKDDPKYKFKSPDGSIGIGKKTTWQYDDQLLAKQFKDDQDVISYKINHTNLKRKLKNIDGKVINAETGEVIKGVNVDETEELKFRINK